MVRIMLMFQQHLWTCLAINNLLLMLLNRIVNQLAINNYKNLNYLDNHLLVRIVIISNRLMNIN